MKLDDIKILVIGDIMLDKYVAGTVERISPEAPVPIINVTEEYYTLGGCGNVARNLAELGATTHCIAAVGKDGNGTIIEKELEKYSIKPLLLYEKEVTTTKERLIADHRKIQMLRVDREKIEKIHSQYVIDRFKKDCINNYDMIIISDYAKGMISYDLMQFLKVNQKSRIIVDPKPSNISMYDGVLLITPNEKEWSEMVLSSMYTLENVKYILETKGKDGMKLISNSEDKAWNITSKPLPIYNVSGAGDVVVAMMAICLSKKLNILTSARIANKCAGYAVTQPQTCVIPKDKFISIYKQYYPI